MFIPAAGDGGPTALTRPGVTYALPAFPSNPAAPAVIAALRARPGGQDDICLTAVTKPRPGCVRTSYVLGPEISWAANGKGLLIGASLPGSKVGLLELSSKRAFSVNPRDWSVRGIVTPRMARGGVLAAAVSPNGRRLAAAENFGTTAFSLAITSPTDLSFTKAQTFAAPTPVCSAQWRTDSALVLVDTACGDALGAVYVVDPAHPSKLSLISTKAADPSWQPLPGVQ
jgi:hypothetical protein